MHEIHHISQTKIEIILHYIISYYNEIVLYITALRLTKL